VPTLPARKRPIANDAAGVGIRSVRDSNDCTHGKGWVMSKTGDVKCYTAAEGFGLVRVRSRRGSAEVNMPEVAA
jgi:hypothetical protein